jgi:hypothetical protein
MSARTLHIIWAVVAVAAIVLLAVTVLNRSWWARRINAKWLISTTTLPEANAPAGFDKVTFTRVAFDDAEANKYGLGELMRLWVYGGGEQWQRA